MGCDCSDEIKEGGNKPKKPKEEKEEKEKNNNKKQRKNILYKKSNMETMSKLNINSVLNPKEAYLKSRIRQEKDKTFSSSSLRQIEIKSRINLSKEDENDDGNNNILNPKEFLIEGGEKEINLDSDNENSNSNKLNINLGPMPLNLKERISRRMNIKYAILEKDNESEGHSNTKNTKNLKNNIYNIKNNNFLHKNTNEPKIDEYKDQKYKYFISRNDIKDENQATNTNTNTLYQKFIRKYNTSSKTIDSNKLGGLLSDEEKKLSLSFESLVPLQSGKPSKKYKVLSHLGNGSYGKVYKAMNLKTENLVAIKSVKKKKDKEDEDKFVSNEIDFLKRLSHPNIVKIYEFYDIKDNYYLITEYCKYGELYKYYKFHFSEKQICVLFYQIFSGLIYLHENNILHGDLKLENIMVDAIEKDKVSFEPYFYIKIIDFGSAKIFSKQKKENEIIGSTYYIAPEVLKQKYNEKCDTWSVGVILYMILTKKAPFNGNNDDKIEEKIEKGSYDNKNKELMEYSSEVRDLLNKLLEVNAEKRYSAKQALNHTWFKNYGGRALFNNFNKEELINVVNNLFKFKGINKLQELVLAFLVHNSPSTEETLLILKVFRYFNTSGNCKLLKEELIEGLYKYKSHEEVDSMVEELFLILDLNSNGYIEYEEFLRACIDRDNLFSKENLKYAFNFIDDDKSNGIDTKKIINAFKAHTNKVLEAVFNNLIIKVDEDGDGIINFKEFEKLLLS